MLCVGSNVGKDWRPRAGRMVRMAWEVLGQAVSALSHAIPWDLPPKPPSRLRNAIDQRAGGRKSPAGQVPSTMETVYHTYGVDNAQAISTYLSGALGVKIS